MRRIISLFSLLLTLAFNHMNAESHIMFEKANQQYHNKNYDSALALYQQMLNDGYCSADLYYNAGNTYYRLNKIGLAIWCYEKAIQIHNDKLYAENLELAKKRIREPIESIRDIFFIRWWESFLHLLTVNGWAVMALLGFLVGMLLLFLKTIKPAMSIQSGWAIIFVSASVIMVILMLLNIYQQTYHYKAIVVEPETLFVSGGKKEPVFIHEGIKVKVLNVLPGRSQYGSRYLEVRLPDGREGRIDEQAIKKI